MRYVLIDRITALEPGRALSAIKNVSLSDDLVARVRRGVSALPASMVLDASWGTMVEALALQLLWLVLLGLLTWLIARAAGARFAEQGI